MGVMPRPLATVALFLGLAARAPAAEPPGGERPEEGKKVVYAVMQRQSDHVVWQRSASELVVWDSRPELGIGSHGLSPEHADLVRELGVRLVRVTLYWGLVEGAREGDYNQERLGQFDQIVETAKAKGLSLLVVCHAPPNPLDTFERKEEAYARYARFMAAMARRYPSVRYWELFNEMDVAFTKIFGATRDDVPMRERGRLYAAMLKLAYPAIKEANPQAWVLSGGMTDWREFPEGIYEGGGKDVFDIMNLHTYGVPIVNSFVDRGLILREVMKAHGDHDKPLWNTEFGIDAGNVVGAWGYPHDRKPPQNDGETFDSEHLKQWRACIEWNAEHRLYQKVLPYQLHARNERNDDGKIAERARLPEELTIDDYGFGLLRRDGRAPRPTYQWLLETQVNAAILRERERKLVIEYPPRFKTLPRGAERVRWRDLVRLPEIELDSLYPDTLPCEPQ